MPLFLAGLLVRGNALPPDIVEEALQRQVITGGALDSSLLELGSLDEATMAGFLARASGLPLAPMDRLLSPDVKLRRVLPLRLADRHGLVPFAQEERTVHMACAYPADAALLDEMGFLLSQRIEAHIAPEFRIRLAIEKLYGHHASARMHDLARRWGSPSGEAPQQQTPAQVQEAAANDPPEWTVAQALARLEEASDRHLAIDTVLRFARRAFSFVAVFGVFGGRAVGWDARGPDVGMGRLLEQVSLPLDTHSVLSTVVRTGGRYLGPIPDEEGNRLLLGRIGRRFPESAFVQPVLIGERTVAVLYADNGDEPVSLPKAAEVMAVVQALGASLERMIRSRKAAASARVAALSVSVDGTSQQQGVAPGHDVPLSAGIPESVSEPAAQPVPSGPAELQSAVPVSQPVPSGPAELQSAVPVSQPVPSGPVAAAELQSAVPVSQPVPPGPVAAAELQSAVPVSQPVPSAPVAAAEPPSAVPVTQPVPTGPVAAAEPPSPTFPDGLAPQREAPGTGRSLEIAARAVGALLASRSPAERDAVLNALPDLGEPVADVLTALLPGPVRFGPNGEIAGGPVIDALATLGTVAVPALHRAASSPDRVVRHWTAVLLGRCDHPLATRTLEALANDPDPTVAAAGQAALESHA